MPARRLRDLNWGFEIYPNQIEVITAEQMLDAYSLAGMSCSTSIGRSASISHIRNACLAPACGVPNDGP